MSYQVYKDYLENYHNTMSQIKAYAVAYLSMHDGALLQKVIWAKSELEAANVYLQSDFTSMDEVHEMMCNSDSWINVLEINDTLTE